MPIPDRLLTPQGRLITIESPEDDDFDIQDIAHSLALTTVFGGSGLGFYSNAQHSFYLSYMVPPEKAKAALLFNMREAYKELTLIVGEAETEEDPADLMSGAMALSFGLPIDVFADPDLNALDLKLQAFAATVMIRNPENLWNAMGGHPDGSIFDVDPVFRCWAWESARDAFLRRFYEVKGNV